MKSSKSPAAALIASKRPLQTPDPSDHGLNALSELIAHNDQCGSNNAKVSATSAIKMLREHYSWAGNGRTALDSLCARRLGRKTYGTP